jgi:hypothetical protein
MEALMNPNKALWEKGDFTNGTIGQPSRDDILSVEFL